MKNLMIFVDPKKGFNDEHNMLAQIQIDNSLELGWKQKNILLVTNFEYEYRGIKALIVDDDCYFDNAYLFRATKIPVINRLFESGLIEDGEIYWFHDFDSFELAPIREKELDLEGVDAGFTNHGHYSKDWNAGSFFFKKGAQDIFAWIWEQMDKKQISEQAALTYLWENNVNRINSRYRLLNSTYNIGIYKITENVRDSKKPIKVAHFHPSKKRHLDLFRELLPERLLKIFENYGIGENLKDLNILQVEASVNEELISDMCSIRASKREYKWEPFMRKYNCQKIAEIGVQRGVNFARMIAHNPQLAVAVDSWIDDGVASRNDTGYPQRELNSQYEGFKRSVADKPFVKTFRDYSFNAVKQFKGNFFDLVYIDADHTYEGALKDIRDWYPKVKKGGFLMGDDYRVSTYRVTFGVIEAVNEFAVENKLEVITLPWYGWALIKK